MNNPIIEVNLGEILKEIQGDQKKILEEVNNIKLGQAKIEGKIEALDLKLSGEIKAIDEKLSGQIKTLDTKVEQMDKRLANQEFLNRGVFIGLLLALLGGVVNFFGWIPKS